MNLSNINKKYIFVIVGVVILAELLWAGWFLTKGSQVTTNGATAQVAGGSVISLRATKNSFRMGENIPVSVEIASDKVTDGSDIVIIYDPKMLSVVTDVAKTPVATGSLYSDYPVNKLDETAGRINVSGITSLSGGTLPKGVFGTVTFQAKQSGKVKISLDFTSGSTTDSNIIETKTAKDVLSGVNNLEVNIQ